MKNIFYSLLIFLMACSGEKEIEFTHPEEPWDEDLGNHRAVLQVKKPGEAIALELQWRRHDRLPANKKLLIIHAESGDTVENIHRIQVDNEVCKLVFGPAKERGIYYFYYLPYEIQKNYGFYNKGYLKPEKVADKNWLSVWEKNVDVLPKAKPLEIQARTPFDSFYPMEIIPLKKEKEQFLLDKNSDFLVFPEDRKFPIRMLDEIPLKWIKSGIANRFEADVQANEYYAFQLGIYSHKKKLKNLKVSYSGIVNGEEKIKAEAFTCFNTEGIDPYGNPFQKQVDLDSGMVQPLWIGIDVPEKINGGTYTGTVSVSADNCIHQEIELRLKIDDKVLVDRGDSEPWRHSRLRWLNSSLGIDDEPTADYQAIRIVGNGTYDFSGKKVRMAETGMPASIDVYGKEILNRAISFVVEEQNGQQLSMKTENVKLLKNTPGTMSGYWENNTKRIKMTGVGVVESDAYLNFKIKLKALEDIHLKDVRLEIPFKNEIAQYIMGMDLPATSVPQTHHAKWKGPHDSFWIGNTEGGLWCELRGSDYHGPLLNLYRPEFPASWFNNTLGGFKIEKNTVETIAKVYSGKRDLKKGEEIDFEWSFLITPVKKQDSGSQFLDRYYHNGGEPTPSDQVLKSGVKIVNLHHANEFNPHINYPFIAVDEMKDFVDRMHSKGQKVKIYYTIRELTNYTSEIWALRSLGNEILGSGRGIGYPWLQEHFINGYRPQWYQYFPDKSADASIVNAPGDSRWLNYYIEGLAWLVKNVDIDGLYLDDVSFDRRTLKRIRKVLDSEKAGCLIDLHSNTGFSKGPATQYTEFFPYVDKLWFGESFQYNKMSPENWLVEVSGIPFGLMGDMLQGGGNRWLGMLFGMTTRLPWTSDKVKADPRPVWKIWDQFGIHEAQMHGFWEKQVLVKTGHNDVKATVYMKNNKALLVLGNFSDKLQSVNLSIEWEMIEIDPGSAVLESPEIEDFQTKKKFELNDKIEIEAKKGRLILIQKKE